VWNPTASPIDRAARRSIAARPTGAVARRALLRRAHRRQRFGHDLLAGLSPARANSGQVSETRSAVAGGLALLVG
jgi:hypothetical protein